MQPASSSQSNKGYIHLDSLDSFPIDPFFFLRPPVASNSQVILSSPANHSDRLSSPTHDFPNNTSSHAWGATPVQGSGSARMLPPEEALISEAQSAYNQNQPRSPVLLNVPSGHVLQGRVAANANTNSNGVLFNNNMIRMPSFQSPRIFECKWQGCQRSTRFSREGDLVRHVKTIHIAPNAYPCHCGKVFGRKDHLREHKKRRHRV